MVLRMHQSQEQFWKPEELRVVGQRSDLNKAARRSVRPDPLCEFCQESDMAQCKTDSWSQIDSSSMSSLGQGFHW